MARHASYKHNILQSTGRSFFIALITLLPHTCTAVCHGHHTFQSLQVVSGLVEDGDAQHEATWQEPLHWLEEAHAIGFSMNDLLELTWDPNPHHLEHNFDRASVWSYRCASTCVFKSENPMSPCPPEYVCAGPNGATAGSPAEQLTMVQEAIDSGGKHEGCGTRVIETEFWENIPVHKSGTLPMSGQLQPKRYRRSCPLYTLVFWSSVPRELALLVMRNFASRSGVRIVNVFEHIWNHHPAYFAKCVANFMAARLHNLTLNKVKLRSIQIPAIEKRGTGPFLVALVALDCHSVHFKRRNTEGAKDARRGRGFSPPVYHYQQYIKTQLRQNKPAIQEGLMDEVDVWHFSSNIWEAEHDVAFFFGKRSMGKYKRERDAGRAWDGETVVQYCTKGWDCNCAKGEYHFETQYNKRVEKPAWPLVDGIGRQYRAAKGPPKACWVDRLDSPPEEVAECVRSRPYIIPG